MLVCSKHHVFNISHWEGARKKQTQHVEDLEQFPQRSISAPLSLLASPAHVVTSWAGWAARLGGGGGCGECGICGGAASAQDCGTPSDPELAQVDSQPPERWVQQSVVSTPPPPT